MDIHPEVKISKIERIKGGTRIVVSIDVDGAGNPIPAYPVTLTIKDSTLKRLWDNIQAEAGRVIKRIKKAVKK